MASIKTIPDFPNYSITDSGEVWSANYKKYLLFDVVHGYYQVSLCKNGKIYKRTVHRLVLETFVGECPKEMEACHNNGIRADNRLKNLRWDTKKNNHKDAIRHGTHTCLTQKGENHSQAKLIEQDVRMIVYMYRTGEFLQKEIAEIYKIHQVHVSDIINKKTWKHIWRN